LGWQKITACILPLDEIDAQLAEIDENLVRNEMTQLERSEQMARRKGLYEAKYPATKQGSAPGKAGGGKVAKTAEHATFAKDAAAKTNQSARTVRKDVQIAKDIPKPVRDLIRDTPVADRKDDLLARSRMPAATLRLTPRSDMDCCAPTKAGAAFRRRNIPQYAPMQHRANTGVESDNEPRSGSPAHLLLLL
jgi:hypothetical protein